MSKQRQNILKSSHLKEILDTFYHADNRRDALKYFKSLNLIKCQMRGLYPVRVDRDALLEYTVQHTLSKMIEAGLQKQRYTLHVPHRATNHLKTQRQAVQDIQQDGLTQSIPLIGWSLLYHIHIRSDLNITYTLFAKLINVDPRTVRRYKAKAIDLLLQHIIQAEINTTNHVESVQQV